MMMRSDEVVNYNFIPHDDHLLNNDGFCVIDNFVGVYGKLITKLTTESFIDMCYDVRGEVKPNAIKQISTLDHDLSDDEDDEPKSAIWTISDGVSPEMLYKICQKLDISHYGFNYDRKCF